VGLGLWSERPEQRQTPERFRVVLGGTGDHLPLIACSEPASLLAQRAAARQIAN